MLPDWTMIPEDLQLLLARDAMRRAAEIIGDQAEALAQAIESGALADRGGPEALRLLATVVRVAGQEPMLPPGRC